MKNIKKFLIIMAMTMIFSVSAFAASGFEFILNVPLGLGIGIPTKSEKDIKWKSGIGFDTGVTAQLGYMFQVKSGFGISVLGELGYAHTTRALTQKYEDLGIKTSIYAAYIMDSFQIGLLPKINIGAFAIGIGGGVKLPVAFQLSSKAKIGDTTIKGKEKIDMKVFREKYSPAVIGYIKGTFDYSIFFTDKLAFNIGLYLGYDMLKTKATPEIGEKSEIEGVFDIGVELGLKFGPKA
ncbi:PorT family protein [uncultured Brachyspira sp.]|uniref:PorT family protein n=1 Tax=uncultured Brachyspira sp. TaxID=221953 RepID=UPI0027DC6E6B|nr:PorT family protein [uncultured Brachyspira sp.]